MRFRLAGAGRDTSFKNFESNESTITIKKGGPVFLDPSGLGLGALSVEGLADNKQGFFFGLALEDCLPGDNGEACVSGFYPSGRILIRSRAASTNDWPAVDSADLGNELAFLTDSGLQALFVDDPGNVTNGSPFVILAESIASAASVASATSNTSIYSTTTKKVQVRSL